LNTFRVRRALLLPLVMLMPACRVGHNPRTDLAHADSAAAADIRATMSAYQDALLRGDARRIGTFFTPDARLSEPGVEDVVGPPGIQAYLRSFFDGGGSVTALTVDPEEIHVDGGVAFELGTFEERSRTGSEAEQTVRGRYVIRWQRGTEATWRIARFLLNHVALPDTAAP
jgi:ketosteroid isomerase-like protein